MDEDGDDDGETEVEYDSGVEGGVWMESEGSEDWNQVRAAVLEVPDSETDSDPVVASGAVRRQSKDTV